MKTKKRRANEIYEDYWQLTAGHTDYFTKDTVSYEILRHLFEFVKNNKQIINRRDKRYAKIQEDILSISPKQSISLDNKLVSIRKEINQFIKIGFLEPGLLNSHSLVEEFLIAKTQLRKQRIFSQILIDNAKFNCSVTNSKDTTNHMRFFLSTLEEVGRINLIKDIQGLMMCKVSEVEKGYLDRRELDNFVQQSEKIDFKDRKYNQISYFKNFLNKMIDLRVENNNVYFKSDAEQIFGKLPTEIKKRDNYKQRLWVNDLKIECNERCMVDRISTRGIGSHIKRWKDCEASGNEEEAWDPNNGLYLNKNLDDLFDKGLISFDNSGKIIINKNKNVISIEQAKQLQNQSLEKKFLNAKRIEFLNYHRQKWNFN